MEIERIGSPSREQFREYVRLRKPVVMTDVTSGWKSHAWTLATLRERMGNDPIDVQRPESDGNFHFIHYQKMPFHEFLERISGPSPELLYFTKGNSIVGPQGKVKREPGSDVVLPGFGDLALFRSASLSVGSAGTKSVLHHDPLDNLLTPITGRKRVTLFLPSDSANIYPYPIHHIRSIIEGRHLDSQMDIEKPDLERFPRFRKAVPYTSTLAAGDMLFLPAGCWHYVQTLDSNMFLNFWYVPPRKAWLMPPLIHTRIKSKVARVLDWLET